MGRRSNNTGSAHWNTELTHALCDLAIEQIDLGNRPSTFFNKTGWANLIAGFKERTGLDYDHLKLKNKWDQLKKEWRVWADLRHQATGLGWSCARGTIDAPPEWWAERYAAHPEARKYQFNGIDPTLEEKLDRMYSGRTATGKRASVPSMSTTFMPRDISAATLEAHVVDDDVHTPPVTQRTAGSSGPSKRKRLGNDESMDSRLDKIAGACESYISKKSSKSVSSPSSMSKAMICLNNIPEIAADLGLYTFACHFLRNKTNRDTYLGCATNEQRVSFLRYCYTNGL